MLCINYLQNICISRTILVSGYQTGLEEKFADIIYRLSTKFI